MKRTTILVLLLLLGSLISACGSTDDSATPSASDLRETNTPATTTPAPIPDIVISDFAYEMRGPVKAGQQVIVVDKDDPSHSVTADAGNSFDVRVSGGGGTSTFTAPPAPGTYAFHCRYHANMHGELIVQ